MKCIVRACLICRKFEGPSYSPPEPPDLPAFHVSLDPPFTHTGLDFAGPLYVRNDSVTHSQGEGIKAYICLFTCASTRAIHLELTQGLNAETFLLAF